MLLWTLAHLAHYEKYAVYLWVVVTKHPQDIEQSSS